MNSLIQEVRTQQNIFAAWRHVKRSALSSSNEQIRGAASEFEHAHQRHLQRIITQLRDGRFKFDPVTGVLKDAKKRIAANKNPRPIAIATLKNRVVQRAILQVLQPRSIIDPKEPQSKYETSSDKRLGKINDVNKSPYGVGGLIYPYGGVQPAIKTIRNAIDGGAKYYYQSDIKEFFTKIPTSIIVEFVRTETKDNDLTDLFADGLAVELNNKDELKQYADLFPSGGIGVAQGSSLSAFAGNVLLYELDHELNNMGVTAVRYIDDILMVSSEDEKLNAAMLRAEEKLTSFGFGLYSPASGSDKAARGECKNGINFLGCTIQPKRCVPSKASIDRLKEDVNKSISESKSAIKLFLSGKKELNPRLSRTATLDSIAKKIYGWQKAFSFCTDENPFRSLDEATSRLVLDYGEIVDRMIAKQNPTTKMKVIGIPSTHDMFLAGQRRPKA